MRSFFVRVLRLSPSLVLAAMLTVLSTATARAQQNAVQVSGNYSYTYNPSDGTVQFSVARLTNISPGRTTGTLRLELWISVAPYAAANFNGYRLATYQLAGASNGRLGPGQSVADLSATAPAAGAPPNGSYFATLLVTEYTNDCDSTDGFCKAGYGVFADRFVAGAQVAAGVGVAMPSPVAAAPGMPAPATAAAPLMMVSQGTGFYFGAGFSASMMYDVDFMDSLGDPAMTRWKKDWGISLHAGYKLANGFTPELELFMRQHNLTSVTPDTTPVFRHLSDKSLMANVIYNVNTGQVFSPYVGAGLGLEYLRMSDCMPGAAFTPCNATEHDSDLGFAWQGIAGMAYTFTPQWDMTLDFRIKGSKNHNFASIASGTVVDAFNDRTRLVTLGFRYALGDTSF